MKKTHKFSIILICLCTSVYGQNVYSPDLSGINDTTKWKICNRIAGFTDNVVYMNGQAGDGIIWLRNFVFTNGKIEVDIKGKNDQGKSFVGIAFHGLNDSTYDVIYFRPFNFNSPERSNHSVQYVSNPKYSWYMLREEFKGKYENTVLPVPNPDDWFHATIVIQYPEIKVYVNRSDQASLKINKLTAIKEGAIGLWVGNNSEGSFKNLTIRRE